MKTTAIAVTSALLFFLAGNVVILVNPSFAAGYFYSARMVAVTHMFTLGWLSLAIAGVLRQLAPFGFDVKLRYPGLAGVALAFWIPGTLAMVVSFWISKFPIAGLAGLAIGIGVALFLFVYLPPFVCRAWDMPGAHILLSLSSLGLAGALGLWLALAKAFDTPLPAPFMSVLFAHIHLAGAGWAGGMILGVMARLYPQPHLKHPGSAHLRLLLFSVGLAGLAAALCLELPHRVFGALLALAMIWYATAYIPVLWRFRRPGDASTLFLVFAWGCLGATGVIGLALAAGLHLVIENGLRLQLLYGFAYVLGGLTLMIMGMLYKIMPTHVSKLLTARGVIGARTRDAFIELRAQVVVFALLTSGLFLASVAILQASAKLFALGWGVWWLGLLAYVSSIVRLLLRLRRLTAHKGGSPLMEVETPG